MTGRRRKTEDETLPREVDTREQAEREAPWTPPSLLPAPLPREGYVHRYVRTSMLGESDAGNVSYRLREGWVICKLTEYPELKVIPDINSRFDDAIEISGQILCRIPKSRMDERDEYYAEKDQAQIESVEKALLREADSRVPLMVEMDSRTDFV